MPDSDWWQALWPAPESVLRALGAEEGIDAIDLCCGDGWFTAALARIARHVTAIDIDGDVLQRAKERVAALQEENCEFFKADAYEVAALVPPPVDFILMANTFHGVPDKVRLVHALAKVVRIGGRLVIINWHRRPREETTVLGQARGPKTDMRMSSDEVRMIIEPSGLRHVQMVDLPPYHYGIIFEKVDAVTGDAPMRPPPDIGDT